MRRAVVFCCVLIAGMFVGPVVAADNVSDEVKALQARLQQLKAESDKLQAEIHEAEAQLRAAQDAGTAEAKPAPAGEAVAPAAPPAPAAPAPPTAPAAPPAAVPGPARVVVPSDPTARLLAEQLASLAKAVEAKPGAQWSFAPALDHAIYEFDRRWFDRCLTSLALVRTSLDRERAALATFLGPGGQGVSITEMEKAIADLEARTRRALDAMPPASIVVFAGKGKWTTVSDEQLKEPFWYALVDLVEADMGIRPVRPGEQPRFELELRFSLATGGNEPLPSLKLSHSFALYDLAKDRLLLMERKQDLTYAAQAAASAPKGQNDVDLFLTLFDPHALLDLKPVPPEVLQRTGHRPN